MHGKTLGLDPQGLGMVNLHSRGCVSNYLAMPTVSVFRTTTSYMAYKRIKKYLLKYQFAS